MENAVKPSLAVEDVFRKLVDRGEHNTMHINRSPGWVPQVRSAPTAPLGAHMKESTRPTLATVIKEYVRLQQLAEAAGRRLPPYNPKAPDTQEK